MTQADLDTMQDIFAAGFASPRSHVREAATEFLDLFIRQMMLHDPDFNRERFLKPFWNTEKQA